MPMGRVQWWMSIYQDFLKGQRFGYAVDLVWARALRNQLHVGLVNAACALHPYRPPVPEGGKHISGLDDNSLGLTDHDLWLEYKANKLKHGVDYGVMAEHRYFARYVEAARPSGTDGSCEQACRGPDETCWGAAADAAYCDLGAAAAGRNVGDASERACNGRLDAPIGGILLQRRRQHRRALLKKSKAKKKATKLGGEVRQQREEEAVAAALTAHPLLDAAEGAAPAGSVIGSLISVNTADAAATVTVAATAGAGRGGGIRSSGGGESAEAVLAQFDGAAWHGRMGWAGDSAAMRKQVRSQLKRQAAEAQSAAAAGGGLDHNTLVAAKMLAVLDASPTGPQQPGKAAFKADGSVCCICIVPDPHPYGRTGLEAHHDAGAHATIAAHSCSSCALGMEP